jgi:hypothetical protein
MNVSGCGLSKAPPELIFPAFFRKVLPSEDQPSIFGNNGRYCLSFLRVRARVR